MSNENIECTGINFEGGKIIKYILQSKKMYRLCKYSNSNGCAIQWSCC